jgi:hypothetical protein
VKLANVVGSAVYGALVFGGTALLGFVLAPALAHAAGLFAIDVEARAFFSLLTLQAVPYLFGLSVGSGFAYERLRGLRRWKRAGAYVSNTALAWGLGVALGALL